MFEHIGAESSTRITLYTDAHVVRGDLRTRHRRLTDVLNATEASFLVLDNVIFEDFGVRAVVERAAYAQINLATILFAVAEAEVEPTPELRMAKVPEMATVSVPPFKITGRIHLLPERDLHESLAELIGRVSRNRVQSRLSRAQILAPFQEQDVWAGVVVSASEPSESAEPSEPPLA